MNSEKLALNARIDVVSMISRAHASHIGSALSIIDILAVLYSDIIVYDSKNPNMPDRDRVILSKGHAGAAMYAILAECGFFSVKELDNYYLNGSKFSGHVSHLGIPGIELSTGSLGNGCAVACGMAMAAKRRNAKYHIYAIVGDGECEEGLVWETALIASYQKLHNFTVIVDHNHMQAMGKCSDISAIEPLKEKWESFGWNVIEIKDGNNHKQLRQTLNLKDDIKPTCIIAHTIKGKGVSFMENNILWHYRDPQGQYLENALHELGNKR